MKTTITESTDEKPKCRVNGFLGKQGGQAAMCGFISVGSKSICCAKPNFECEHKEPTAALNGEEYE